MQDGDARYLNQKRDPITPDEVADQIIQDNPIYREVHRLMNNAQREQVAYGADKYVETLNVNSWSMVETIDHIISENVDQLHYLVMWKAQVVKALEGVSDDK